MDENKNIDLKPEEIFGGFSSDFSDTFLPDATQELKPDSMGSAITMPENDSTEAADPRVIKIEPPLVEPVVYPVLKKSPWPYISACFVLIVLFASIYYFLYLNLSLPFVNKFGMTEIQKDDTKQVERIFNEKISPVIETNDTAAIKENVNNDKIIVESKKIPAVVSPEKQKSDVASTAPVVRKPNKELTIKKVDKPLIQKNEIRKTENEIPGVNKSSKQTIANKGVYSLEVYSTPSYEDAKLWQDKLGKRKLSAVIIPQRIRDQIIYKVRFGNFSSEEEARKTAINMGFSRSLIDRIR